MIRVVWLLVAACGAPSPSPTTPAPPSNTATKHQPPKLAALDDDQRCRAVAERTLPCIDEVVNAAALAMMGVDLSHEPKLGPDEGRRIHEINCKVGPSYSDAIVTCWTEGTCLAFGTCVERHNQVAPRPRAKEPEPLRLDP